MSTVKENLIKIATQTVQKSGIHSLTIRELGESIGIKSSSVMYHFKSKDGLIQELINSYSDSFSSYLNDLDDMNLDNNIKLDKFVDIFEDTLKDNRFCLAGMLASQNKNIDETTTYKTTEFFKHAQEWLTRNLPNDNNAIQTAKVIISSLEGAMMLDKLDGKTEHLSAVRNWIKSLN